MADQKYANKEHTNKNKVSNKKVGEKDLYYRVQKNLIASLLYDGSDTNRVLEITSPEDFSEPTFENIMDAIVTVARSNEKVTVFTVAKELENVGNLQKSGGLSGLYQLRTEGEKALLEAQPEIYASIVRQSSAKNTIAELLETSKTDLKDDSGVTAESGIENLQSALSKEMFRLADDATMTNVGASIGGYLNLLKEREELSAANAEKSEGLQGIPTLVPSLNKYTSGFMPEQLITVGARTAVGKTVFAIMSAIAAARAKKTVLFFSLEMSSNAIVDRIVANMSGVSLSKLSQGLLTPEETEMVNTATAELEQMHIIIDTDPKATLDSVRSKALRQSQTEAGLDMVVVDYLQLLSSSGRFGSRQEQVADLSRNMKLLAKSLKIPVMILSQVNNRSKDEGDENKPPTLDNIRESAAIAQDSDIVILLHRDVAIDNTTPHTLIILAKNRNGESQKTIRCHSNLECSMFREISRERDTSDKMTEEEMEALTDDIDLSDFDDLDDDIDIDGL